MSRRPGKPLPHSFYLQPTLKVARSLLGKHVVRTYRRKTLVGRVVEVEAYVGPNDPASHAYIGKTERNKVMFGKGGHAYVYFTYGMHYCFNVVTEREGYPAAVLIRAVEPIEGIDDMKRLRKVEDVMNLASGPAKFCQAFAIDKSLNGESLNGERLFITAGESIQLKDIGRSSRIGVRLGAKKKWRFFVKNNPFVSRA